MNTPLCVEAIQRNLHTQLVGCSLAVLPQVGSTNDLLRAQAAQGVAEGAVVIAEEQLAGRGRQGKRWHAPPGTALLLSILLRPTWLAPRQAFLLTMLAGVSLCEAVAATTGLAPRLKWPNDLLLPKHGTWHKAAGILVELGGDADALGWAVVGCGTNVSWHPPADAVSYPATSLADAAQRPVDRVLLAQTLLAALDKGYAALRAGEHNALFTRWRGLLQTIGRAVRVETLGGTINGIAEDVTRDGLLLVRDEHGVLHQVASGDVSVR